MIRLLLLRHAKSAWDNPDLDDIDRPLSERGERAADLMGRTIVERNLLPDLILCSPSVRTRLTLRGLRKHIADTIPHRIVDRLYDTPAADYASIIADEGGDQRTLMVIGHNPTIQRTATILTGSGDAEMHSRMLTKYPTAALAVIDFDKDAWADISEATGELKLFLRPRDLES